MKISKCRSCKSKKIKKAFDLGLQSLTGVFPEKKETVITKGRLSLVLCSNCSLLQLANSFDHNEMYGDNYGYMSSLNYSMINHLKNKTIKVRGLLVNHSTFGWEIIINNKSMILEINQ